MSVRRTGAKKTSAGLLTCGLLLVLLICLAGGVFVYGNYLLSATERDFGQPHDGISISRRLQYALAMNMARNDLFEPSRVIQAETVVEIDQGESVPAIISKLEQGGFVRDADAFKAYLLYTGLDTSIQAGKYRVPGGINAIQLAQLLQDASSKVIEVNFVPGLRMEEVAQLLVLSGASFTIDEFYGACRQPQPELAAVLGDTPPSCEGFLYPGYYEFDRGVMPAQIIAAMEAQFSLNLPAGFVDRCASKGMGGYSCVILGSMIEKEAIQKDEQRLISSVFHNRIAVGMKFESDPTVQYAVGNALTPTSWWKNPLDAADLAFISPYNTYQVQGLPPTPIASMGSGALIAAAEPATSDYYFFRARCDKSGYHNFSRTYDDHVNFACP